MYHPKNGWCFAENSNVEAMLRKLGWVEDRPEYSPKYVAPIAGPQGVTPPVTLPPPAVPAPVAAHIAANIDAPKRGRPRKTE
jgi:hypothetical protein